MPTKTSTQDGNWTAGATWVGGVAPVPGDDVVINHVVTVNTPVSVKSILATGASSKILDVDAGAAFVVTDSIQIKTLAQFFFEDAVSADFTCPLILVDAGVIGCAGDYLTTTLQLKGTSSIAIINAVSVGTPMIKSDGSGGGGGVGGGGLIGG